MISKSCSIEYSLYGKHQFLALVQIGLFFAILPYFIKIKKVFKQEEKNLVSITTSSTTCYSTKSIDTLHKFASYLDILFYSILASIVVNLFYVAFSNILFKSEYTELFFYFPLFAIGAVIIGYSTDGFIKVKDLLNNEPVVCKNMFRDVRIFFILCLTVGCCQAAVSGNISWNTYTKTSFMKTTTDQQLRRR